MEKKIFLVDDKGFRAQKLLNEAGSQRLDVQWIKPFSLLDPANQDRVIQVKTADELISLLSNQESPSIWLWDVGLKIGGLYIEAIDYYDENPLPDAMLYLMMTGHRFVFISRQYGMDLIKNHFVRRGAPEFNIELTPVFDIDHATEAELSEYCRDVINTVVQTPETSAIIEPEKFLDELLNCSCPHPNSIEQIPSNFILYQKFDNLAKEDETAALESFKALYFLEQNNYRNRRALRVSIFSDFLGRSGIKLQLRDSLHPKDNFQLPVAPGMIFGACLVYFLNSMKISEAKLDWTPKSAMLMIPLKEPKRFESAMLTGTGSTGMQAFRNLMACNCKALCNGRELPEGWPPRMFNSAAGHGSEILEAFFNVLIDVDNKLLTLLWPSLLGRASAEQPKR